jgi:hypothetical protein
MMVSLKNGLRGVAPLRQIPSSWELKAPAAQGLAAKMENQDYFPFLSKSYHLAGTTRSILLAHPGSRFAGARRNKAAEYSKNRRQGEGLR